MVKEDAKQSTGSTAPTSPPPATFVTPGIPQDTSSSSSSSSSSVPDSRNWMPIVAVVAVLVLAIGAVAFFFVSQKNKEQMKTASPTPSSQSLQPAQPALNLTVDSPTKDSLVSSKTLTVSGKTQPNATVTVYTDVDENSVQSDDKGAFTATVSLDKGINSLTVTAFSDNEEKSTNMNVVYDDGSS